MIQRKRTSLKETLDSGQALPRGATSRPITPALLVGQIGSLSALIAFGTILSNVIFNIILPPPLYEITVAPAFYLAIAVLYPRRISFWATAIGSGVGEAVNLFIFGQGAAFALTFIPGIIIARAPETAIVHRFRDKAMRWIAASMVIATIYESLAFFLIDWPVYSYTAFYCTGDQCSASGLAGGFWLASLDFFTIVDIVWIPVAIALILAVRRAYNTRYFG
jgi:hypothetical protein